MKTMKPKVILVITLLTIILSISGLLLTRYLSTVNIQLNKETSISALNLIKVLIIPPDRNNRNKTPLGRDNNYFRDNKGNIYWYHNVVSLFQEKPYFQLIPSADAASFEEISCGELPFVNCDFGFAKDKYHVYRKGKVLEGVDSESFKFVSENSCILNQPCFEDKNFTYIFQYGSGGKEIYLPQENTNTVRN